MAWIADDNTYNDIREKSLMQWLDSMENHEDIEVRGGVRLARDYIKYLEVDRERLKEEIAVRNEYLKKMKSRVN